MAYGTVNADVISTSTSGGVLGAGNASIMKNRIINGPMVIDQRNAGASVTPTDGAYTLDRWKMYMYSSASKYTVQQNAGSVTPPVGFANYMGITSSSAYTLTSTSLYGMQQRIEGYNVSDLGWGTASAKTVTLSFWVYSSLTGTFGGSIANGNGNRAYPFSYTISSANTWTQASITIPGDTTGTWFTTNNIGMVVNFGWGVGSTFSGTAGAWVAGEYYSVTGATSVVGTSGATFYITGVQLEVGSSATGFEYVNYQTSLANCQRYYEIVGANTSSFLISLNGTASGQEWETIIKFLVSKRTQPTMTRIGTWTDSNCNSVGSIVVGTDSFSLGMTSTASGRIYTYNNNAGAYYTASAEL